MVIISIEIHISSSITWDDENRLMIMRCSGHRLQRMIVLSNPCDSSEILHLHPTKLMGWQTGMMSSLSEGWTIWWYDRMSFNSIFDYSIIHACDHSIIQWFYHLIIRLCCIWLFDHSIIWSLDHSIIGSSTMRSSDYSVVQSFDRSSTQSFDPRITRSFDHLVLWRLTIAD
jgi:hypothetical protein